MEKFYVLIFKNKKFLIFFLWVYVYFFCMYICTHTYLYIHISVHTDINIATNTWAWKIIENILGHNFVYFVYCNMGVETKYKEWHICKVTCVNVYVKII
jgi:hypothetical protein